MKIAILGFDVEGKSSYEYFAAQDGHEITILDQNTGVAVPEGAESVLGANYLDRLGRFDLIVRTAGLPPKKILEINPGVSSKITSHINEFFKASPTKNIIGVTGTKGKGTTSTLIAELLKASGKQAQLAGNIGVPALSLLDKLNAESWVVLELSSFQLIDLKQSPHIAICLMVTPEHLDWHSDSDEYFIAKTQLFTHQTSEDIAVYFANNETSKRIASVSPGWKIPYMESPGATVENGNIIVDQQVVCKTSDLKLPGEHNWQNVCAAITAVWKVAQDIEAIRSVVTSFEPLPNRIEFVREVGGISYYNDSYSTGLHSTVAAIEAIQSKKVMILGGYDRELDIDFFGEYVKQHEDEFRSLLLIGQTSGELGKLLQKHDFANFVLDQEAKTMTEIVSKATSLAKSGDAIVLSPGFASFDMFKNFEDRGTQFRDVVKDL